MTDTAPAPDLEAVLEASTAEESAVANAALLEHYRDRCALLNREVRLRDSMLRDLTARLEVFEAPDNDGTPNT
jgi:hypothetical protein